MKRRSIRSISKPRSGVAAAGISVCVACALLTSASSSSCVLLFDVSDLSGGAALDDAETQDRIEVPPPSLPQIDARSSDGRTTPPAVASSVYRARVLEDNPIAYYRFSEEPNATSATSETPSGVPGAYVRTKRGLGIFGQQQQNNGLDALTLDGTGHVAFASAYDFSGNAPFAYEVWLRPVAVDTMFRHALTKQERGNPTTKRGPAIYLRNNSLFFERWVAGSGMAVSTTVSLDQWIHVVAIYDGGRLRLYVNALEVPGRPDIRAVEPIVGIDFFVGTETSDGTNGYVGDVDELAIYDHVLTLERIKAHFDAARN